MIKVDYKEHYNQLYSASPDPELIPIPPLNYISIKGKGDPEEEEGFRSALKTLQKVSEGLIELSQAQYSSDYFLMPQEGRFWCDNMGRFAAHDKTDWKWEALVMQPEHITQKDVTKVVGEISEEFEFLNLVKFITINEGFAGQMLYKGALVDSASAYDKLAAFVDNQGFEFDGQKQLYHEIYLTDFKKAATQSMKTIFRQPVE